MSFLLQISCVLISWYTSEEMEGRKFVKIGGKLVKMGENGWKWVKMGENWVKIGENWKFHFYEFLVIFCNFGWFQAILVHFEQFVKGVVQFLKGDGQLVKGADSLKLLSKLAVFPLLLIHWCPYCGRRRVALVGPRDGCGSARSASGAAASWPAGMKAEGWEMFGKYHESSNDCVIQCGQYKTICELA